MRKAARSGPRAAGFNEESASASVVPSPSDPTTVPSVNTSVASTTSRNGGSAEPATAPKFLSHVKRGAVMLVSVASVRAYSNAPTYGTSTSTTSGASAGRSSSQGAARPRGGDPAAGPGSRGSASAGLPSLLGEELVDLCSRAIERLLGRRAPLDRLLDRGVELLDDLGILRHRRSEVDNLRGFR